MNGKVATRAWLEVARLYLCIASCFLLFAALLTLIVYFSAVVYIGATGGTRVIFFWAVLYTVISLINSSKLSAAARANSGSVFDLDRSEPRYLGQCIRELCNKRGINPPEVRIREEYHPLLASPGSLILRLIHRDVLLLPLPIVRFAPPPLLRALVAHELRHQDASSSLFPRSMRLILEVFVQTWLGAVVITLASLLLIHGRSTTAVVVYAAGPVVLLAFTLATNFLIGVVSRCDEFKTDIASCVDTEDHQSLARLLSDLDHHAALLTELEERRRRFESIRDVRQDRPDSSNEGRESTTHRSRRSAWALLVNLPSLLITTALIPYMIAISCTNWDFRSHPTTADRLKKLEALFGPIEPWMPAASNDDDTVGPGFVVLVEFDPFN